jgi:hypothetical protein
LNQTSLDRGGLLRAKVALFFARRLPPRFGLMEFLGLVNKLFDLLLGLF